MPHRCDIKFSDYYKYGKCDDKHQGKFIFVDKIPYTNHFRYKYWLHKENDLNTLEIMDKGDCVALTIIDMLRLKKTVLLLDFMKGRIGIKDKDSPELVDFTSALDILRLDNVPGFLIVHVSQEELLPDYFRELFDVIPLDTDRHVKQGQDLDMVGERKGSEYEKPTGAIELSKRGKRERIPDNLLRQIFQKVDKDFPMKEVGYQKYYLEASIMTKLKKYDKTGKGYTKKTVSKKHSQIFSGT